MKEFKKNYCIFLKNGLNLLPDTYGLSKKSNHFLFSTTPYNILVYIFLSSSLILSILFLITKLTK